MARIDTLNNYLLDIANKFREKLGITSKIDHVDYDNKIDDVYDAGKTAEYERFWENALSSKTNASFEYTFADSVWNDETLRIPSKYLPLKPKATNYMFRYCDATVLPSVDFTECRELKYTYAYARSAITIGAVILKEDGTNTFTTTFTYCDDLQNITFEGVIGNSLSFGRSPKLSSESIDNIIEHLKDLTGTTPQTLTLHSTPASKITEAQAKRISDKNWDVG